MVDRSILARKIAAVRDAIERIRELLPATSEELRHDRTAREVITLNLFVAIQECVALATHWLADAGWGVPESYGEVFTALGERGVLDDDLAASLRSASGLRNLIAHQYGVLDYERVFELASSRLGDLSSFCEVLSRRASEEGGPPRAS
jgi:uncharacterized protein YutE (UPF0331/DUF86 family)